MLALLVQRAEEGVWTNVNAIERVVADVNIGGWLMAVANQPARATFGIASRHIGRALAENLFVCVTGPKDPLAAARVPEANAVRDVNTVRATLELDKSERTQRWLEREAAKPPPPRPPLKARRKSGAKTPHEAPPSPDRGNAAPPTADPLSAERRACRDGKAAARAALDEGAAQGATAAAGIAAAAVEASPPEPQDLVARAGGIRFDVKKIALLKPRGRIVEPNDPTATNADYVWHTDEWIAARAADVTREIEKLKTKGLSDTALAKAVNDFCADQGHAFSQGLAPYMCSRTGCWGALHMDNNLAQGTIEMYNSLAEDMAEYYKLDYRDARSPHARLHAALRATGRRLGRHVAALEARVMGGEFETFRIAGDDCIDYFLQCWRLDGELRLGPPWVEPNNYWWFRRLLLATRARLHRAISVYQVRCTL